MGDLICVRAAFTLLLQGCTAISLTYTRVVQKSTRKIEIPTADAIHTIS